MDDFLILIQLVVGAAVLCEDKATFIRNIFQLNHNSQSVLKGLIERVLENAEDEDAAGSLESEVGLSEDSIEVSLDANTAMSADDSPREEPSLFSPKQLRREGDAEEERLRLLELLQHLQTERQQLLSQTAQLTAANLTLTDQLRRLQDSSQERRALEACEQQKAQDFEQRVLLLQTELEELRRDQDLRAVQQDRVKSELRAVTGRFEQARELLLQADMKARQQADELDVARDKASKLSKAEQTLEKYQRRLEEMGDLKKLNKELSEKLDEAQDQLQELESANRSLQGVQRLVEQYRNKAVQLEREKIELLSATQAKEAQLGGLQAELEAAVKGRYKAEDELAGLRSQLLAGDDDLFPSSPGRSKAAEDTVASLRDKLRTLQRKEREMGVEAAGEEGGAESQVLQLLRVELEGERALRCEREEQLLFAKRALLDAQQESGRVLRAAEERERSACSQVSELGSRLAETGSTIAALGLRLQEKEALVDKLEADKAKLESYTKRSLGTFKEKYMAVLQAMKEEKRQLEAQVTLLQDKAAADRATWQREERLLAAAIFEVGVRIMDRRISGQPATQTCSEPHQHHDLLPQQPPFPPSSAPSTTSTSNGSSSSSSSTGGTDMAASSSARSRPPLPGVRKEPTAANT